MTLLRFASTARRGWPRDENAPPSWRRFVLSTSLAAATLAIAALAGHQRLFSTFLEYDDEGYVLLTLQSFASGQPLYDATYSQYGPAFYALESGLRAVTGWPLTHDATRFKTLAIWLLASGLAAGLVYRLTRQAAFAWLAFAAAFVHLEKLSLEPGHPQEWCLLGVLTALFAATLTEAKYAPWRIALLALSTAVVACIKLNLGVFLGLAIVLALTFHREDQGWRRTAVGLLFAAAAALPLVLLRERLGTLAGWRLPATVLAGLAGLALIGRGQGGTTGGRELAAYVAATVATMLGCMLWCLGQGTSLAGLAEGLLLQHGRFTERFYHPLPVPAWTPLAGLAGIALAVAAQRGSVRALRYAQLAALGLAAYLGLTSLVEVWTPLEHGLVDRGGARLILALFAPLAWLVIWPTDSSRSAGDVAARRMLAVVAVLQPLATYPTPGTQLTIGTLPLLLGLVVVTHDLWRAPALERENLRPCVRGVVLAWAALLALGLLARDVVLTRQRAGYVALDLPGAQRLKLPAAEARRWRWAAQQVQTHGTTFVGLHHAQCSLYFWAQQAPPTPINATFWSHLLREPQQRRIIAALEREPRSCVFYNRRSTSAYDPGSPLVQHLLANYEPAAHYDGLEVWRRK